MNKTGLPFYVRSTRSNRPGSIQDIPGETNPVVLATPTPYRWCSHYNLRVVANSRGSRLSPSGWKGVPVQDRGLDLVKGSHISRTNVTYSDFRAGCQSRGSICGCKFIDCVKYTKDGRDPRRLILDRGSRKVQTDQSDHPEPKVRSGQPPEYRYHIPGTRGCRSRKRCPRGEIIHALHEDQRRETLDSGVSRSQRQMVSRILHSGGGGNLHILGPPLSIWKTLV